MQQIRASNTETKCCREQINRYKSTKKTIHYTYIHMKKKVNDTEQAA